MAKKIGAIAFSALFVLALAVPALNTNLKPNQRSDIDNRMLNELPGLVASDKAPEGVAALSRELAGQIGSKKSLSQLEETIKGFTKAVGLSLQDRVGFRAQMLAVYQKANKTLFGVLAHPSCLEGREGHFYSNSEEYINGYRNIYDEERLDEAARYLARIKGFLDERGVGFFFFLPPDKKTVYPEYFPSYIHKTAAPPLIDALLGRLDEAGVECVCPLDAFLSLKGGIKLYNKQYDVTHWNADGACLAISLLLDKIHARYPQVLPLDRSNYERTMAKANRLPQSDYRIDEDVPAYTLKDDCVKVDSEFSLEASGARGSTVCTVYDNADLEEGLTALIFCDSYLACYEQEFGIDRLESDQYRSFLNMSFKRTVFVHSKHLYRLAYFLNIFSPDIVILESVERVVDSDECAFNKERMAATFFPRASSAEMPLDESVAVSLEEIDMARRSRLTSITGKLKATGGAVTQVYVKVGEREYPAQVDAAGRFSLALSNAALDGAADIALVPVNGESSFQLSAISYQL